MEFLTPGEKIKKLRKKLNMRQYDLQGEKVKRNFISMIETGERGLSRETARLIAEKFNKKALELGIEINVDEEYILMSPEEEARKYCAEKLNDPVEIETIDEIIEISNKYNLHDIEAKTYTLKGDYFFNNRDYLRASIYYIDALAKYGSVEQKSSEAYLFNKLGLCNLQQLHYTEALEFFNKAHSYSFSNDDFRTRKSSIYNISLSYRKLGEFDKSIEYINDYLNLCDKNTEFTNYIYANVIKANCYKDKKYVDKAEESYNELVRNFTDLDNPLLAYVYDNLGLLYADTMNYEKAIECLDISQRIRTESDIVNLDKTLIDKASIYIKQKMYNEALILINLGIDMAKKYNDNEYELKGYYMLADIYEQTKNTAKLKETYTRILDIIRDKNNHKEILNICGKLCLIHLDENNLEKTRECLIKSLKM